MEKEITVPHNWNYTLPSLIEYFESILKAEAARNQSDLEIINQLNSSLFVLGNLTDPTSSIDNLYSSTPATPVHKPFFTFNFTFKSTISSFIHNFPFSLNASGFQLLSSFGGSSSYDSSDKNMAVPESTNLLMMNLNESFVSIDDAWWLPGNESYNVTGSSSLNSTSNEALSKLISMVVTSTILGIMIFTTVIGNVFVIAAILLERNLQQVANFLIVSLAVADLMVACLVMPLGAVYEISNEWILGPELCDMWTSSDVLCCTASILHLVAIALDRYWAVTQIDYIHSRNGKRIGIMIFFVWMTALTVSIAPQFGWKDPDFNTRVNEQKRCLVSQDISYQIFATSATFYVPLTAILILYWKIFQAARKRIHKRPGKTEITKQMLKKSKSNNNQAKFFKKQNGIPKQKTTAFMITTAETAKMDINQQSKQFKQSPNVSGFSSPNRESPFPERKLPQECNEAMCHSDMVISNSTVNITLNIGAGNMSSPDDVSMNKENATISDQNVNLSTSNMAICQGNMGSSQENLGVSRDNLTTSREHLQVSCENIGPSSARLSNNCSELSMSSQVPKPDSLPKEIHKKTKKETLEAKREKKAAKTLAIITGAFVICWLPFFVTVLVMTICPKCWMSDLIFSIFLWLGYFNSTLNPIIYTIFSPEFRQAFKRILCGKKHQRYRPGKVR